MCRTPPPFVLSIEVTIRDLRADDLAGMAWTGRLHAEQLAGILDRARTGVIDYLVACLPTGVPVGRCVVDVQKRPGAGTLGPLDVRSPLRSCGIGTALLYAAERRIAARGLSRAAIEVEESNDRALALYQRLGYVRYGREPAAWDQESDDGTVFRYETTELLLRKELRGC